MTDATAAAADQKNESSKLRPPSPPSILMAQETEDFLTEIQRKALQMGVLKKDADAAAKTFRRLASDWVGRQLEESICRYPDCDRTAIAASHTLQENGPLKEVAADAVQRVSWWPVGPKRGSVGKGTASTFPGFCTEHEGEFDFEKAKKLETHQHYVLQLYRTAVKEHWRQSMARDYFMELPFIVDSWRQEIPWLDRRFDSFIHETQERWLVRGMNAGGSAAALSAIEAELAEVCFEIPAGFGEEDLPAKLVFASRLQGQVPYAYSGACHFWVDRFSLVLLLVVIPQDGETLVLMTCEQPFVQFLVDFRDLYLHDAESVLGTVESWAIHRPDDWYFSSDWWNESPERQKMTLQKAQEELPKMNTLPLDGLRGVVSG